MRNIGLATSPYITKITPENRGGTIEKMDHEFSGVILVMYGDVVNPIFCIALLLFVKILPKY